MIAHRLSQDNTEFKAMLDFKSRPCFKQQLKTHRHTHTHTPLSYTPLTLPTT